MVNTAIGLLLVVSVVVHVLTIVYLLKAGLQSFIITLQVYINLIFFALVFSSIFLLNDPSSALAHTIFNIQLILQLFIPPALFMYQKGEILGTDIPKITSREILFFAASLIISLLVVSNQVVEAVEYNFLHIHAHYSGWYYLLLIYFYFALFFMFFSFYRRIQRIHRRKYRIYSHRLLILSLPFFGLGLFFLHFLPFLHLKYPVWLLGYPILSAFAIFISYKWKILDLNENLSLGLKYLSLVLLLSLFFVLREHVPLSFLLMMLIVFLLAGYFAITWFGQKFNRYMRSDRPDKFIQPDKNLEEFTQRAAHYHDLKTLAGFLSAHFQAITGCSKSLILISKFDFHPYEVISNEGFSESEIKKVVEHSIILASIKKLEKDVISTHAIRDGSIKAQLKSLNIDYLLALRQGEKLTGYIVLAECDISMNLLPGELEFLKIYTHRAAAALEHVKTLQLIIQDKKMAELGLVASQLAHDFQSFITLVKLDVPDESRLREQATYMEKLVHDLLNYARPQELKLAPANINQLIDMSLDLVTIKNNISIEKNYDNSLPELNVDSTQLRRVFQNLLSNSIRSMEQNGGRIKITTRPLRALSSELKNPWIYIEILDEGCGIPDEFFSKIFEPFFTTYKHKGGNGMGLAVVKQIITRHKGFIDVTSKQEKGTVFNIRLPYIGEVI